MSMFSDTRTDPSVKDEERDSVGGSYIWESDTYPAVIDVAYGSITRNGATMLHIVYKNKAGKEITQSECVISGNAKGNQSTYPVKENGKETGERRKMPGLTKVDGICQLVAEKDLWDLPTEKRLAMIWDFGARAKIEQEVEMVDDLIGAQVIVGVLKKTVDKNVQQNDGSWKPEGDIRIINEVDKVFDGITGRTLTEIRAESKEAKFIHTWREKWRGKDIDESTKVAGESSAKAGAPAATEAPPTTGLFE